MAQTRHWLMSTLCLISALCCCTIQAATHTPITSATTISQIVAVVGQEPITTQDIKWRIENLKGLLKKYSKKNVIPMSEKDLRQKVLDTLILEQVNLNYAASHGIRVSADEVAKDIDKLAQKEKTTSDQLINKWVASGFPRSEFTQEFKRRLIIERVRSIITKELSHLTTEQVMNFIQEHKQDTDSQIELQHITLPIEDTDTSGIKTLDLAHKIIAMFHAGRSFDGLVLQYSKSPDSLHHGLIGWRYSNAFPIPLQKALATTKEGDVLEPIRTKQTVEILFVKSKRKVPSPFSKTLQKKIQIIQLNEDGSHTAKQKLENLKSRIEKNKVTFEHAATLYAEDKNKEQARWVNTFTLPAPLQEVLNSTDKGQLSAVFCEPQSCYLLKVFDTKMANLPLSQQRVIAERMILQQKGDQLFNDWLIGQRKNTYIRIMDY